MGSTQENAMIILKAMVEGSKKRGSGDAIKRMTNLECGEINEGIDCLEKMHLVRTLPGCNTFRYKFLNVILEPEGCRYYSDHFGKIRDIA
ncbi:hypothetical protein [Methanobacterium sp. MBAC-LM]|uniref:hypothetical protein n=1 Tax=Methanobacterium sp. MBAC-LM TaxID=3412034 RepID=UPI00320D8124